MFLTFSTALGLMLIFVHSLLQVDSLMHVVHSVYDPLYSAGSDVDHFSFSAADGQSDTCGAHVCHHLYSAGSDVCADGGGAVLRRGLLRGDKAVAVVDAVSVQGEERPH